MAWKKDLSLFKDIKSLHIYCELDNLSFISSFQNLKELYIIDYRKNEWTFIEELFKLEYLLVVRSDFSDLTPIANLCRKQAEPYKRSKMEGNHERFNLHPHLSHLFLNHCNISDISPLEYCKHLFDVDLSNNEISDIRPLISENLKSIYYLTLRYNKIEDISSLQDFRRTYYINLRHNNIKDISVLERFKTYYIGRLYIGHNPIEDYGPLSEVSVVDSDVEGYTKNAIFSIGVKFNEED